MIHSLDHQWALLLAAVVTMQGLLDFHSGHEFANILLIGATRLRSILSTRSVRLEAHQCRLMSDWAACMPGSIVHYPCLPQPKVECNDFAGARIMPHMALVTTGSSGSTLITRWLAISSLSLVFPASSSPFSLCLVHPTSAFQLLSFLSSSCLVYIACASNLMSLTCAFALGQCNLGWWVV